MPRPAKRVNATPGKEIVIYIYIFTAIQIYSKSMQFYSTFFTYIHMYSDLF